jgi:hypothetical protein
VASYTDNGITKLLEAWDNRLSFPLTKLLQRYLHNWITLKLDVRTIWAEGESDQFRATFGSLHEAAGRPNTGYHEITLVASHPNIFSLSDCANNDQEPMLVGIAQISQNPEQVGVNIGAIPVWLERSDDIGTSIGDALDLPLSDDSFVFLSGATNRKLMSVRGLASVEQHKLPDQMIKDRTQLVDNLSRDYRKNNWRALSHQEQCALAGIRVFLMDDSISVTLKKQTDISGELANVRIGPFNLRNYSSWQGGHGG